MAFALAGAAGTAHAQQAAVSEVSIVRFSDPPVAVYGGGKPGLRPTTPSATGDRRLDSRSAAARAYRRHLADVQQRVIARAERAGPRVHVARSYRIASAGFAAKLTPAQVRALREDPRVASVEPNVRLTVDAVGRDVPPATALGGPVAPQSAQLLGLPSGIWAAQGGPISASGAGAGKVIGILDTGIDPALPSFAASSAGDTVFTGDDFPPPPASFTGTCEPPAAGHPPVPCTNKIVGARWYQVGRSPEPGEASSPFDTSGHGTHVAGIAAGNYGVTPVIGGSDQGMTALSGIAPRAQIAVYKVCPSSCPSADLLAAFDDAVADGVDVINTSIGTTRLGHPSGIALARLAVQAAGIPVATSAGNAGPAADTVGTSSAAWWMLAVGSTLGGGIADSGNVSLLKVPGGPAGGFPGATMTPRVATDGSQPHDLYDAPAFAVAGKAADAALCKPGSLTGVPAGAYIVCDRGETTFASKIATVRDAGAGTTGGVVFVTNGNPIAVGLANDPDLESMMVTRATGATLRQLLTSVGGSLTDARMVTAPSWQPIPPDLLYFGSSRGPTELVPDVMSVAVAAPGVAIPAAYARAHLPPGGNATFLTGTSMAAPQVAGVLALLRRDHPDWTPDELRSALVTTGLPAPDLGVSDPPAPPYAAGGGRIDPSAATQAGLLVAEDAGDYDGAMRTLPEILGVGRPAPDLGPERDPADLNVPYVVLRSLSGTRTVTRTVRSADASPTTWNASPGSAPAGWTVAVSPASFTIAPGGVQKLTITVAGPASAAEMTSALVLTESGGSRSQRVPIAARTVAGARGVPHFDVETTSASGSFPLPPASHPTPGSDMTAGLGRLVVNEGIAYCAGGATETVDVPPGTDRLLVDARTVFMPGGAQPTVAISGPGGPAVPPTPMPHLRVFESPAAGTWTIAVGGCNGSDENPVGAQLKVGLIGADGVGASVVPGSDGAPPRLQWSGLPEDGDYVGYVRVGDGSGRPDQMVIVHRRAAPSLSGLTGSVVDVPADAPAQDVSLKGIVNPGGAPTWMRVEHGPTSAYGESTEPVALGAATEGVPIDVALGSLAPGSERHARLLLERRGQVVAASDDVLLAVRRPPEVPPPPGAGPPLVVPPLGAIAPTNAADPRAAARACARRLVGKRRSAARVTASSRRGRLAVRLRPSRRLRAVRVELRTAKPCSTRSRPLARALRRSLAKGRSATVAVKLGRVVKPGTHVVLVTGRQGRRTFASATIVTVR